MASPSPRQASTPQASQSGWRAELAAKCSGYIKEADKGESRRRRSDIIGSRMLNNQHWLTRVPRGKVTVTVPASASLVKQKLAIMTKQDPIPVVLPLDASGVEPARKMNLVLQHVWRVRDLRRINRRALLVSMATRTCGVKVVWDRRLTAGNGDMSFDIVPGYRLIADKRTACGDVERMRYIGDRAIMRRSEALLLYPDSTKAIMADAERIPSQAGIRFTGSSFADPWHSGLSLSTSDSMSVNNVPVIVTPSMMGPGPQVQTDDDDVEVVELYHKDYRLYDHVEIERDALGSAIEEPVVNADGIPEFEPLPDELVQMDHPEHGSMTLNLPNFKVKTRPVIKKEKRFVYPFWRRTTMMFPDSVVIDDRAWDGPAPYALYTDEEPLDGSLGKGSLLSLFTLQGVLNTGVSENTNNIRQGSMQGYFVGAAAGIEGDQIIVTPGRMIRGNDIKQIEPIVAPTISDAWIKFNDHIIALMKFTFGLEGIMQGEAPGRMDNAAGVDTLAEISAARVVADTQNMESSISRLFEIAGWYAQNWYTEKHAIAIENQTGQLSWERVSKEELDGQFVYRVAVGSTLAWSETAQEARVINRMNLGLYDKVEAWKQLKIPNWQEIRKRLLEQPPVLSGHAGSPPPRTRSSPQTARGRSNGSARAPRA